MAFKLHEWNETDFTGGCLAYLNKAYEVAVFEGLQETHTVSFKYPMKDLSLIHISEPTRH